MYQHLHQPSIIRQIRTRTVREEGEPYRIHGKMSFNPIGRLVEAKTLGVYTRITGILDGLRVNDDERCPLGFFLTCWRTCPCKTLINCSIAPASRHCL